MKSDFVSTVSHELRTPLTSIYGFAETLLRRDIGFGEEERGTFLGYIASESQRLIRIVDDLLNVARLESGTLGLAIADVDVPTVVDEVLARVDEQSAGEHQLVLELPPGGASARCDRHKLAQIVANLVDNAIKFSPEGGRITIAVRRRADAVEVRVSDEGVGIPPGDQQRIFTKFYRAGPALGPGAQGTGLGLFLARGLLAAMGGRIWVESKEGVGSTFAFELPVTRFSPVGMQEMEAAARS
jgi:signal transduction histidine kinase